MNAYRRRRVIAVFLALVSLIVLVVCESPSAKNPDVPTTTKAKVLGIKTTLATATLAKLTIKGRAPATGYKRDNFGADWAKTNGCDTRNIILNRDLKNVVANKSCEVVSGILQDPYTGKTINFKRGASTSSLVQIDHVVALSDAWQKGAQDMTLSERIGLANDPLELLAVDGRANVQKSNGDAATWLPSNKAFRCEYIARQIAVKFKYHLWVTIAERDVMRNILQKCPDQMLPSP